LSVTERNATTVPIEVTFDRWSFSSASPTETVSAGSGWLAAARSAALREEYFRAPRAAPVPEDQEQQRDRSDPATVHLASLRARASARCMPAESAARTTTGHTSTVEIQTVVDR
jgi:hypothetical protein